uniref:Chitin binding beak protein 2 n=1 Tax=Dosidicus gigas TaxID=346249 RepID=A0A0G2UIZ7_DOSGI|nr:chitin binding beak protein 2 [Dosidicus gigas]
MYRTAAIFIVVIVGVVICQDNLISICKNVKRRVGTNLVRDQGNCSVFYSCRHPNPRLFPMACGYTTVFSQSQQVCVMQNSIYDDCKRSIYGGTANDPLCRPHPSGLNRDPADCTRFIPCFNHTLILHVCQDGSLHLLSKECCRTGDLMPHNSHTEHTF